MKNLSIDCKINENKKNKTYNNKVKVKMTGWKKDLS